MTTRSTAATAERRAAFLAVLILSALPALLVSACGSTGGAASPSPTGTSSSGPGSSASAGSASVATQAPNPAITVVWGDGRNAPGMKEGVPNPAGWYDRAFGGSTTEKVIYLTFDDGPRQPYTSQVLALLARYRAKATFFVLGQQARELPALIAAEARAGHAIGDHTWDHADLIGLSDAKVRDELASVQRQVGSALGPCMRPPYGLVDERVAGIAFSLGLTPILWTAHAQDWDQPPVDRMVAALQRGTKPGAVILLHDGGGSRDHTVAAVGRMLPWWQSQGYRLETVPACRVGS